MRCSAEISGPSREPGAYFAAAAAASSSACSIRPAGTTSRESAVQVWPPLRKQLATVILTAFASSSSDTSASTTLADLPPSSSVTRLSVSAATPAIVRPTGVDPVNETWSTCGWRVSRSPTTRPLPGTRLNAPAGSPASSKTRASSKAASGVSPAGLSTTVVPAASAGTTFTTTWCSGRFHGVIAATTPTGSRRISELPLSEVNGKRSSASMVASTTAMGVSTCRARATLGGEPCSRLTMSANTSARSASSSRTRRSRAARSATGVAAQPGNAPRAAATAASTSSAEAWVTTPVTCSVAGFSTSRSAPPPGVHSPPM